MFSEKWTDFWSHSTSSPVSDRQPPRRTTTSSRPFFRCSRCRSTITERIEPRFRYCYACKSFHLASHISLQALAGDLVLSGTLETLVSTNTTSLTHVFGCLLAFAANDFDLIGVFVDLEAINNADWEAIDAKIVSSVDVHSLVLHNPIGIATILRLLHLASPSTTHAVLKLLDRLVYSSHRNQALLNQSGIIMILFDFLHALPSFIPKSETLPITKSLKRLLEMGAPLEESRIIFKSLLKPVDDKAVKPHELNTSVLELLRTGMRAAGKWPSFLAFGTGGDHRAGIEMPKCHLNGRTFPGSAGFTFLVSISPF